GLGLLWVSRAATPLTPGLKEAQKRLGVEKHQMAMVGDQLFTDRMAAALYGIPAYVVVPRGRDCGWWVRAKRVGEKPFWNSYYKKGGKTL
ncbi:MAG: HAD hydrolase-like protein, partial [Faecalibacterium sp.]|nr:HAD hydrolase-like protein [Faecalibacterium sp.]